VLFLFKKLVGPLFFPQTICLGLLVIAVGLLWFSSRQKLARFLATLAALGFLILSYPLIWRGVIFRFERENPPLNTLRPDLADVRWVVVLGGGGEADPTIPAPAQISRPSLGRLVEGLRVHNALPSTKLVFTGGGIFGEEPLAVMLQKAAESLGVNPQQIVITATPRDTEEESVEVKRIVLLAAALVAALSTTPTAQGTFRAGVDVVSLNVTAVDPSNHYVTDLDEKDFSVFEDGVKQDLSFFTRKQQPIALSLLLDSSASMEDKLATLQTAAGNFVRRLKSNDMAQVIDFDSRVEIRQGFTSNQTELQSAIQQTSAGGSTSLYNAIYIALKELAKVKAGGEEDVRRQALVLFSDGEDTSSLISFDEVLELAKRSEVAIFTIALRGADTQSKGFHEAEFVMRQLAQETGGRSFFPAKIDDLNGVYSEIADELASQYTLGYTSKNAKRDGAYRRIVVQVDRPNVTPRTKRGYYAPTSR